MSHSSPTSGTIQTNGGYAVGPGHPPYETVKRKLAPRPASSHGLTSQATPFHCRLRMGEGPIQTRNLGLVNSYNYSFYFTKDKEDYEVIQTNKSLGDSLLLLLVQRKNNSGILD